VRWTDTIWAPRRAISSALLGLGLADALDEGETLADGLTEADSDPLGLVEADGLTLADAEPLGLVEALGDTLADTDPEGETDADGLTLGLSDPLGLTLALGLTDGLSLLLGETEADGLTLDDSLLDGETEADGLRLAEALDDGLTLALGLTEGDSLGETDGDTDALGPNSVSASTDGTMNDSSTRRYHGRSISTCTSEAPGSSMGLTEGDTELDGDTDALALEDGDTEALSLEDGDTDGLGPISLNATPTAPQSSDDCVHDMSCDPAVPCNRYCAPPPCAPSSTSYSDVPVRAEGAKVCAPLAQAAKMIAPLIVGTMAPVAGFADVLFAPASSSNAEVRPFPARPVWAE